MPTLMAVYTVLDKDYFLLDSLTKQSKNHRVTAGQVGIMFLEVATIVTEL